MKSEILGIVLIAALHAAAAPAAEPGLQARLAQQDGWVAYHVPMAADVGEPCCFSSWRGKSPKAAGCDLDGRNWSFGSDDEHRTAADDATLAMYVRIEHGKIERVRAVAAACPVKSAGEIRWIENVDPVQSVNLLSRWIEDAKGAKDRGDYALPALAYHAEASATRALAALAAPSHARDSREQALFWLGQARGAEGADIVERFATTDEDPELRAEAIFALSQSHATDPYARIHAMALNDPSSEVRSQAMFWMAQMKDDRAAADITAAIRSERSDDAREQAVFALSQLEDGKADEALIALLRGDYPREVKKQALFWLGQSGSPRAMQYLDEALTKSP
jgi:HEAT repeat protein